MAVQTFAANIESSYILGIKRMLEAGTCIATCLFPVFILKMNKEDQMEGESDSLQERYSQPHDLIFPIAIGHQQHYIFCTSLLIFIAENRKSLFPLIFVGKTYPDYTSRQLK